ncbi:FmdB family zinc ribbon protein [Arthrobacter sp. JSM 101049]|uniref:FmdB family zinc ribbon protein n=1 Tax=Arthrobacter sp. JSM 101049 TaxID=929097 RepID=UPI003562027E
MPTYAYACKDCDHAFETVQSFSDDSLTECPACHGTLRKKFNSVGVVFKGSGFYRTDSRNSSNATAPAAPSTGSSASTGSSDTSSGSSAGATPAAGSSSQKVAAGS